MPEKERRLGVAHFELLGNEGKEVTALSGQTCDMGVDVLIAVFRDVQAVEGIEIGGHGEKKAGGVPERQEATFSRSWAVSCYWGGVEGCAGDFRFS